MDVNVRPLTLNQRHLVYVQRVEQDLLLLHELGTRQLVLVNVHKTVVVGVPFSRYLPLPHVDHK
jgi:hypothetical protein